MLRNLTKEATVLCCVLDFSGDTTQPIAQVGLRLRIPPRCLPRDRDRLEKLDNPYLLHLNQFMAFEPPSKRDYPFQLQGHIRCTESKAPTTPAPHLMKPPTLRARSLPPKPWAIRRQNRVAGSPLHLSMQYVTHSQHLQSRFTCGLQDA